MFKITPQFLKQLLDSQWSNVLNEEFDKKYFKNLAEGIDRSNKLNLLCPKINQVFRCYNNLSLNKIKIVIVGQDPYHGKRQANGYAFAVNEQMKVPPSLKNIYKEIEMDLKLEIKTKPNLKSFTNQGVFLLNSSLSVEQGKPNSHQKLGWNNFTDKTLKIISKERKHIVFFLWGEQAKNKEFLIDQKKHLILKSSHPSPLSAYRGFFGAKHFSKANNYLVKNKIKPINWGI
tara:strand:- start:22088 stop:22780 length:693 start_codon:yes stop_codon:yes gene_type:complete